MILQTIKQFKKIKLPEKLGNPFSQYLNNLLESLKATLP